MVFVEAGAGVPTSGSRLRAPEPPKLETVPGSSDSLRVSWTPVVSDPPVQCYALQMRKVGETQWQPVDAGSGKLVKSGGKAVMVAVSGSANGYVVSGLEAGVKYEAKLCAANAHGFGSDSSESTPGKPHVVFVRGEGLLAQRAGFEGVCVWRCAYPDIHL